MMCNENLASDRCYRLHLILLLSAIFLIFHEPINTKYDLLLPDKNLHHIPRQLT